MLEVRNLCVRYGELTILDGVSFTLLENEWMMVVGPNGAGKSTVVSAISQGVPYTGSILLENQDVRKMKPAVLAQHVGVLSQTRMVNYSFTVEEVVRLGRYAHSAGFLKGSSDEDDEAVHEALEMTGLSSLRGQSVLTLSGGELQRTFLAQVFAQRPGILILDEPTNHLDLKYQDLVFSLIDEWYRQPGRAVLSVVHDLALARAYGTGILLLNKGKIVSTGDAERVFSPQNLQNVYAMDIYAWMNRMLGQWKP